ncbi:MAG: hypothetical protein HY329_24360 [Chloroflexi bacterium]|nr:hypothetical protein [Chloroflexota bacterium]
MSLRRWGALIFSLVLLVALGLALLPPYLGDSEHYKYWTRLVTIQGLAHAYSGTWPETYAVYPPVSIALLKLVGHVYVVFVDPTFALVPALHSEVLTYLTKLPGVVFHAGLAVVVFAVVARRRPTTTAISAACAYGLNPGALYDVAIWGQPDSVYSFFAVAGLAVLWLTTRTERVSSGPAPTTELSPASHSPLSPQPGYPALVPFPPLPVTPSRYPAIPLSRYPAVALAWLLLALAAWSKPQAWALLPLALFVTWSLGGWIGLIVAGLTGAAVTAVVMLPYLLAGTLDQLLSLPSQIASVFPVVSANAHNLWWLLYGSDAIDRLKDTELAIGSLSFRTIGLTLFVLALATILGLYWLRSSHSRSRSSESAASVDPTIFVLAATVVLAFTSFSTQIHENHAFTALPLLAIAAGLAGARWPLAILSVTYPTNLFLHDPSWLPALLDAGWPIDTHRLVNSATNLLLLGALLATQLTAARRGTPTLLAEDTATATPRSFAFAQDDP